MTSCPRELRCSYRSPWRKARGTPRSRERETAFKTSSLLHTPRSPLLYRALTMNLLPSLQAAGVFVISPTCRRRKQKHESESGGLQITRPQSHRKRASGGPRAWAPQQGERLRPAAGWRLFAMGESPRGSLEGVAGALSPREEPPRGAGAAGKEPPATGALGICALGVHGARPGAPPAALPPLPGCAERMRRLRVNRACFPFTPSGSVFMKNFLLLALWEYSFLACAARG